MHTNLLLPPELERQARRRAGAKSLWYVHAVVYISVNLVLALMSAMGGKHWAVYPAMGWGLGLAIHGLVVFVVTGGSGLHDEFDRLGDYLALMSVRMGPRLTYTLELPQELAKHLVPTLLLHPLVENAIKHGLEPKIEGGSVTVSARSEGANIVLDVTDSGVGLMGLSDGTGFGLRQVRERLQAAYGDQATINLGAACALFTRASITFPFED